MYSTRKTAILFCNICNKKEKKNPDRSGFFPHQALPAHIDNTCFFDLTGFNTAAIMNKTAGIVLMRGVTTNRKRDSYNG